ncbi:hypothetical protein LBMAG56_27260 [Verrucomicrobiota bacterium]|nr:hypothetical protein LBMAG56_27260 [Verrucomicrobiota bacterium]
MSRRAPSWKTVWRLAICGLLLLWVSHTIFVKEGRQAFRLLDREWDALSTTEQWRAAWTRGPAELWRVLCFTEPWALGAAFVLMGVTVLLGILRWRMVLRVQGLELPFSRAAEISLVAHFFNSFMLGSSGGDLMKAYYAARETHHLKTEAVVTVFVDRLIGLFAMLLFGGLMMLPNLSLLFDHRRLAALSWFTLLMLAACTVLVWVAFWGGVSRRWPGADTWLKKLPKAEHLRRSLDSCRAFGRHPGFVLRALVVSMVLNAVCVLLVLALVKGLHLEISVTALFAIVPIISCISALPLAPSGLGVRENLFVWMLAVPEINIPATQALSLSLLAFAVSLVWSLIGGAVYLGYKETHHLREVAEAGPGAN